MNETAPNLLIQFLFVAFSTGGIGTVVVLIVASYIRGRIDTRRKRELAKIEAEGKQQDMLLAAQKAEEDKRIASERADAAARQVLDEFIRSEGFQAIQDNKREIVQQAKQIEELQRNEHLHVVSIDALQIRANEQERKIFQLETTNQKQAAQITDLTQQIERLTKTLNDMTQDNIMKDGIIAKLTEQLQAITNERDELVKAKAASDEALVAERLERARLQTELETLRKVGTGPLVSPPEPPPPAVAPLPVAIVSLPDTATAVVAPPSAGTPDAGTGSPAEPKDATP